MDRGGILTRELRSQAIPESDFTRCGTYDACVIRLHVPQSEQSRPELTLQGSLFGDVQPAQSIDEATASTADELSDTVLSEDAKARPRRRLAAQDQTPSTQSSDNASVDDPSWSHHSQVKPQLLTPMLRHYVELKASHPERVLLYRLGDFFECFFEDAITLSRVLELTLTGKEGGKTIGRVPMAGIPHHAADRYCAELIRQGFSVALCDQLETTPAKGSLLKRDITRVLTPGTVLDEGMLSARRNNWLAAVVISPAQSDQPFRWGLASADVSTGEVLVMQRDGSDQLHQQLSQLNASELLWHESGERPAWCPDNLQLTRVANTPFNSHEAESSLRQHYRLISLDGIGLPELPLALSAMGGLVSYLKETQPQEETSTVPLDVPTIVHSGEALMLDAQTRRNLELTATQRDGQLQGSLLWALDRTLTAMGGRCLRRWLEAPLMNLDAIQRRQHAVAALVQQRNLRQSLRKLLRPMGDLERLAGRAGAGHAGARDLVAIADGLERLPRLAAQLKGRIEHAPEWLEHLTEPDAKLAALATTIRNTLVSSPPLSLSEGGLVHDGVDPLLDGLRNQLDDQDGWLAKQEQQERQLSGNSNLRLQHHRTFGYFLAVSKAKAGSVPDHWIRRQTLSNEERFITPALKQREGVIFQMRARAYQREYELFSQLRETVGQDVDAIRRAARSVAALDAVTSLAEVAATSGYCQPDLVEGRELELKGARHPVVEQLLVERQFKANDVTLGSGIDLVVLTGPNASGKSCYLRQIGLVQILAQIGSWVPAETARVGITDRIFTRVGAVDDLAAGQSTFMVEMAETANILHHATSQSLVLLDEIGRGTATFDGLSIAWAVSEHLAGDLQSRTIFATHYHELNNLAEQRKNVANYQVLVQETGEDLIFLHQVSPGGASRSYGIEAARLAGVPATVVQRAKQVLDQLAA